MALCVHCLLIIYNSHINFLYDRIIILFIDIKGLFMAIPAYLWLKDDGGSYIMGSVDVKDRDGSIEILGFGHDVFLPTDALTGKITFTHNI